MSKSAAAISDLQASDLVAKFGLSRSYAFELVNQKRKPSLELAVKIEHEFGVPAAAWLSASGEDAAA